MSEKNYIFLYRIIKMPFIFILYVLYMLLSIFIPSKYITKIISIEMIENDIDYYIKNHIVLKIIAIIITMIIFIYMQR